MQAIVSEEYGGPEILELRDVDVPQLDPDGVLVRVRASSVNPYDWHVMRGLPYLVRLAEGRSRPKQPIRGVDVAGVVEAVGENVTAFRPGDEVFGAKAGALAEFVCAGPKNVLAAKPAGLTFEQAAAIPLAGVTALQALRDKGRLETGQRVLVNGASGGVGTFAVQIAKALGAEVTGVCSARNAGLVTSNGADRVLDYAEVDFARSGERYDLVLDNVGNRSLSDLRRVLTPHGTLVVVGGGGGNWIGPMMLPLRAAMLSPFVGQRLLPLLAKHTQNDLLVLKELAETGKIVPVIDRTYPLAEAAEAIRYLETGHARGKVVVTVTS